MCLEITVFTLLKVRIDAEIFNIVTTTSAVRAWLVRDAVALKLISTLHPLLCSCVCGRFDVWEWPLTLVEKSATILLYGRRHSWAWNPDRKRRRVAICPPPCCGFSTSNDLSPLNVGLQPAFMDLLILLIFLLVLENIERKYFCRFWQRLLTCRGLKLLIAIVECVKNQANIRFIPIVPVVDIDELPKVVTHHVLAFRSC